MNIQWLYERAVGLMAHPEDEWKSIREEGWTTGQLVKKYLLPFSLFIGLATLFGLIMFGAGTHSFTGLVNLLISVLLSFVNPFILVVACSLASHSVSQLFGGSTNPSDYFRLICYSFTPAYFFEMFSSFHWTLEWMNVFGLYSVFLFWKGISPVTGIPNEKKGAFSIFFVLTLIILWTFLYWFIPYGLLRG